MKTNNLENMQLRKHDKKLLKQLEEHANKQLRQQATLTTSNLYNINKQLRQLNNKSLRK